MEIVARKQYDVRPVLDSDLDFKDDKGLTKQADAKDCDINALFKRFERTGQLPDMIARDGRYGDFSSAVDFQESLEIVRRAEEQFSNLDAHVRNRFENDPAKFLAFVTDVKNVDEVEKMGLLSVEAVARRKAEREAVAKLNAEKAEIVKKQNEDALIAKIKAELNK